MSELVFTLLSKACQGAQPQSQPMLPITLKASCGKPSVTSVNVFFFCSVMLTALFSAALRTPSPLLSPSKGITWSGGNSCNPDSRLSDPVLTAMAFTPRLTTSRTLSSPSAVVSVLALTDSTVWPLTVCLEKRSRGRTVAKPLALPSTSSAPKSTRICGALTPAACRGLDNNC